MGASGAANRVKGPEKYHLAELARDYLGEIEGNKIADPTLRDEIIQHRLNQQAFQLTLRRNPG